ncbi:MAG: PTS transporter subunit EIIB [Ruminococcus sp.]
MGGKENLISGAHCATRLRLVVKDEKNIKKEEIEEIEGVKGVVTSRTAPDYFRTGVVNRVYDEFVAAPHRDRNQGRGQGGGG